MPVITNQAITTNIAMAKGFRFLTVVEPLLLTAMGIKAFQVISDLWVNSISDGISLTLDTSKLANL